MKADYLRYIFECLHGDNGIFFKDPRPPKKDGYNAYLDERKANEVNDFFIQANLRESEISCELSDKDFHISSNKQKSKNNVRQIITENLRDRKDMSFMDFFEIEVN